ncbi:MAG: hypothetical protein WBA45_03140 [Microthrixaceae bacterium]
MILGYLLAPVDNDSYMLQGDMPHPACSACGYVTDHEWIDPSFRLRKPALDAGYTYDGYLIVSERLRSVVGDRGALYDVLPSEPGHFSLRADEEVRFDTVRRRTRFEGLCETCGRYEAVAGATPVFLIDQQPLPDRLVRTDIEFGSGDEKGPLLLLGEGLGRKLQAAGLKGVDLVEVSGE